MAFKKYVYGTHRKEIRRLLRKRLNLKDKINYHRAKANKFEKETLPEIEKELDELLEKAEKNY